jgi:hypothetical protein
VLALNVGDCRVSRRLRELKGERGDNMTAPDATSRIQKKRCSADTDLDRYVGVQT